MQIPVQISFRNMDPSPAIEAQVHEKARLLEEFSGEIVSCRVIIEEPHRHHHQGNLVHVRIELGVPGKEIVVNRDPQLHHAHADAYVALHDAFDAAVQQLREYNQKRHRHRDPHDRGKRG